MKKPRASGTRAAGDEKEVLFDDGESEFARVGGAALALRRFGTTALETGGEGGIRTHGPREGTPVFKTGAFNRSATSPAETVRARTLLQSLIAVQPEGIRASAQTSKRFRVSGPHPAAIEFALPGGHWSFPAPFQQWPRGLTPGT